VFADLVPAANLLAGDRDRRVLQDLRELVELLDRGDRRAFVVRERRPAQQVGADSARDLVDAPLDILRRGVQSRLKLAVCEEQLAIVVLLDLVRVGGLGAQAVVGGVSSLVASLASLNAARVRSMNSMQRSARPIRA
jgi:hypothetical protein